MKSAFVSLALATSLIGGPAMAASASKAVLPQPAAGHAPHGWNTGLIDGSIKLRPTPAAGLAAAAAAPAAAQLATAQATQALPPSQGTAPAPASTAAAEAGPGALPYLAAGMALLAFLALRLRRGD